MYTVKQLSDLAGVSVRTLHYYDEIGLLKPTRVGENGYRYYEEEALFRLQQILFFREMDLGLTQIKEVLGTPNFDQRAALQAHRQALQAKIDRLQTLIETVDDTIKHLTGEVSMSKKKLFKGFSEKKQKQYEKEAGQMWGEDRVKQSVNLWNSYSDDKKQQIMAEGSAVYTDIVAKMDQGPESPVIHTILERWHQHMRYFYEPNLQILRGLGNAYNEHPSFNKTFTDIHPDLPAFLQKAINHYVDVLELAELERELALLEA